MTISETARYLGKSRTTIHMLLKGGRLPTTTIGRRRLIVKTELDKMLQGGGIPVAADENFAPAYAYLKKRERYYLSAATVIACDHVFDSLDYSNGDGSDVDLLWLDMALPAMFHDRYDVRFMRNFAVTLITVADRIATSPQKVYARTVAEQFALRHLIAEAESYAETCEDSRPLDYNDLEVDFFEGDFDINMMDDPVLTGLFEIPDSMYHISHWFDAFTEYTQFPYFANESLEDIERRQSEITGKAKKTAMAKTPMKAKAKKSVSPKKSMKAKARKKSS